METLQYILRKLVTGLPQLFGVTLVSFVLMVYFGPDLTWELVGKNPTAEEIEQVRRELGYDQHFVIRYLDFLREIATLDFGHSFSTGERVTDLLGRTVPVSLALILPGFVIGNLLGILFALVAAFYRSSWIDRTIMAGSAVGMSISFLVVIIMAQLLLSSSYGFNWFPVRGWSVHSLGDYLFYVTVPTLVMVFVSLGYNTRFYRAVFVEELSRDHIRTARAYGISPARILLQDVLKNSLIPIITRIMFSIPLLVVSGSLLIESYFGIPGIGRASYDAILSGDQPVLKAVVSLTAVLFVLVLIANDILYKWVDPRVVLK
jgi:peptide/nickel transport system permease protein